MMQWLDKKPMILLFLLGALVASDSAGIKAATIDTFQVAQAGWQNGPVTGMLTGTFTGTVEASGLIEAADLTRLNIQVSFSNGEVDVYRFLAPPPLLFGDRSPLFSYNVNGGASSLAFVAESTSNLILCEGAAAIFGCGAPSGAFGSGFFGGISYEQASITLLSSVTTNPGSPPGSSTPEPASAWSVASGLALAGAWRWRSMRKIAR